MHLLTFPPAIADVENGNASGHETTKVQDEKPNAFDKVQADENDGGKTAAKVSSSSLTHSSCNR